MFYLDTKKRIQRRTKHISDVFGIETEAREKQFKSRILCALENGHGPKGTHKEQRNHDELKPSRMLVYGVSKSITFSLENIGSYKKLPYSSWLIHCQPYNKH